METITAAVVEQAVAKKEKLSEKTRNRAASLLGRVKKLRVLGIAGSAMLEYFATGQVSPWVAGGMATASGLLDGEVTGDDLAKVKALAADGLEGGKTLLHDKTPEGDETETPRKAIQAFRDDLEATLADLNITLVVLIDDLARCLPKTAIATLEAIRC